MGQFRIGAKLPECAKVEVFEPCECSVCKDTKSLWFMCPHIHERMIAAYACTPVIEYIDREEGLVFTLDSEPADQCIADIKAKHPGKVLVY